MQESKQEETWRNEVREIRKAFSALENPAPGLLADSATAHVFEFLLQELPLVNFSPFELPNNLMEGKDEQPNAAKKNSSRPPGISNKPIPDLKNSSQKRDSFSQQTVFNSQQTFSEPFNRSSKKPTASTENSDSLDTILTLPVGPARSAARRDRQSAHLKQEPAASSQNIEQGLFFSGDEHHHDQQENQQPSRDERAGQDWNYPQTEDSQRLHLNSEQLDSLESDQPVLQPAGLIDSLAEVILQEEQEAPEEQSNISAENSKSSNADAIASQAHASAGLQKDQRQIREPNSMPQANPGASWEGALSSIEFLANDLLSRRTSIASRSVESRKEFDGGAASKVGDVTNRIVEQSAAERHAQDYRAQASHDNNAAQAGNLSPNPSQAVSESFNPVRISNIHQMDANKLASLINDALVEQARRHGVDIS